MCHSEYFSALDFWINRQVSLEFKMKSRIADDLRLTILECSKFNAVKVSFEHLLQKREYNAYNTW